MSEITWEDVMRYCYSRNLCVVSKEALELMKRPIVIETIKGAIPVEWIKEHYGWLTMAHEIITEWEKENK